MNLVKQIDDISVKMGDRLVYDYLGDTNTYDDLKKRSDSLAFQIDNLGLSKTTPIIVYGDQTFNTIVAFIACVKSGHAYIPVDEHSSEDRITMIQDVAHAELIIALNDLPVEVPNVKVITSAKLKSIFNHPIDYVMTHPVGGDDNFYIIFTSGTTGKPKGVQISHDNLQSFLDWMDNSFGLPEHAVGLSQTAYSFDLSGMDLYPTLTLGGELQAIPREVTEDFRQLFNTLENLTTNFWVSTPSFVDICLLSKTFNQEHYPELNYFFLCGEELTHSTAERLKKRFPDAHIYNTYGPTEATVAVTAIDITDEILEKYDRLPIGYIKSDSQAWIDVDGEQKFGENGELILCGPTVSKGYLNAPEKTEKSFFVNNGQRAYRTGDVGMQEQDGLLFFAGRKDFQIKMHGFRIELEEIAHYLNQLPQINQGVVVPKYNHDRKVSALIAYVVKQPQLSADDDDLHLTSKLKDALQHELMPYMIPQQFVYRDNLPLNINGKVDINTLIKEVNANG